MKTGGCLCGKVRYQLKRAPENIVDCHCIDCRRSSGAPYVTWGTVARQDFQAVEGELRQVFFAGRIRSFAPCCGTPITFQESRDAEWLDITLASLDEPNTYQPAKALWCEDHLPWVPLNPQVPQFRQSSENKK